MSKKKKKNEPAASGSADVVAEREEQETSGETKAAASDHEGAAEAHGEDGHGHGGHDPVEDDRPQNGLILIMTGVSIVTMIAFCIFVRELFNVWGEEELQKKVYSAQSEQLRELRTAEKQKLSKYQWVSQKDGVLRIPTDRAVDLTIAAYRNPPPPPAPKLEAPPTPKPEDIKPEDKPDEKKGDDGKKDEKGKKDDEKGKKKGDGK